MSDAAFRFHYPRGLPATELTVSATALHRMAEGLGFNWYSCCAPATYPAPEDDQRWARIFAHADWLNMGFVRFGQSTVEIAGLDGAFRSGHSSFGQLRRLNEWARRRHVSILLDPFSIPKGHQFEPWPEAPTVWGKAGSYHLGVRDVDRYVRTFVVPYVSYVVREMGCSQVRWFNHVNEPLHGGVCATPPGIDDHARYVETLAAIRQGLNEAGLAAIGNMGPDTHTHHHWPIERMLEIGADPDPYIQAYCMHHYHSHFDWDHPSQSIGSKSVSEDMAEHVARYVKHARSRGKPYLVTELGMFHYGWAQGDPAGIARHDNALLEAEFAIRAMTHGVDGVLRWAWLNPGDQDGWWQLIQTIDSSDSPMPQSYYLYGTLLRYVSPRAEILGVQVSPPSEPRADGSGEVHAVATRNEDGSHTLLVINDDYRDCARVRVRLPEALGGPMHKVVTDPVRKHHYCGEIRASEFEDYLPPMSLTAYTTSSTALP